MLNARVFAYRLPEAPFEQRPEVGGYWIAGSAVEPLELLELDDLVRLHVDAEIDLRVLPNLWPLWNEVVVSTREYSGMRFRNARPAT